MLQRNHTLFLRRFLANFTDQPPCCSQLRGDGKWRLSSFITTVSVGKSLIYDQWDLMGTIRVNKTNKSPTITMQHPVHQQRCSISQYRGLGVAIASSLPLSSTHLAVPLSSMGSLYSHQVGMSRSIRPSRNKTPCCRDVEIHFQGFLQTFK